MRCGEWGLPNLSSRYGNIAARASEVAATLKQAAEEISDLAGPEASHPAVPHAGAFEYR